MFSEFKYCIMKILGMEGDLPMWRLLVGNYNVGYRSSVAAVVLWCYGVVDRNYVMGSYVTVITSLQCKPFGIILPATVRLDCIYYIPLYGEVEQRQVWFEVMTCING